MQAMDTDTVQRRFARTVITTMRLTIVRPTDIGARTTSSMAFSLVPVHGFADSTDEGSTGVDTTTVASTADSVAADSVAADSVAGAGLTDAALAEATTLHMAAEVLTAADGASRTAAASSLGEEVASTAEAAVVSTVADRTAVEVSMAADRTAVEVSMAADRTAEAGTKSLRS
jgi:hypothetical protein